jgi:Ti-type conjugative transfer relaxase TraA
MRLISRSKGNTVNALAYFSGTNLYDERTGQWFYHAHKDVAHVELLLPKAAPLWARELQKGISSDRQSGIRKFSALAEASEKRKNSQVYREFEFALPKELTNEQNITLAREFLQDQVCGRGIAVVANFHFEEKDKPHCHALMMIRRLAEEGFGKKERDWNKKDFLLTLREQLASYTNFHLKLHGHDIRIDHRSYAERGIDIESQHIKTLHKRSGFDKETREDSRRQYEITRQRNVARLIKNPHTVFDIVTSQQSTFMWGDVEKVLARYVREEDIFDSLKEKLQSSRELVLLREEERVTSEGTTENASIYTTQSMLRQELFLVRLAEKLGEQQSHGTREEDVETALNRANTEFAAQGSCLSQDQIDALRHITKGDQLSCLVGYAGAGKSTTFKAAKEVWEASGYKVYGLAPTGRAAQNLEEMGLSSQTLHKFLKDYEQGRSQYHQPSVLVLDEAGMVDVGRFNDLLHAVDHLGVKLVISGDGAQSQPIEAGPGFRLVTDRLDVKKIETIVRQQVDWQKEATRLFGTYHTREALEMYLEKGHVQFVEEKVPDLKTLISQNRQGDVVELYNLSRRICGNMWQSMADDLKEQKIPQDQVLKTAVTHEDYTLFKHWQEIRNQIAVHMKDHLDTYRNMMTEKGVDPITFAALFVEKDLSPHERQQEIRKLLKEWKLETPHPLTPLHSCDLRKQTREVMVKEWAASLKAHPESSHLMVAYTHKDTHLLNEDARHLMRRQGVMDVAEYFHTVKRESRDDFGQTVIHEEQKTFSKGERIVFTRNDRGLKVKNGTLGTIEAIDSQKLKVKLDGDDRVVSFTSNLYPYFDRGWAITIIKSQGSTADHVFKLATFDGDRNLAYVGMTRHRASLQVFGSTLDFWKEDVFVDPQS